MRYNVHSPCAFHNRSVRYLGVLVAAALVATLGLPGAAQAQTPAAPTVLATDGANATINLSWGVPPLTVPNPDPDGAPIIIAGFRVEYAEPGEDVMAIYLGQGSVTLPGEEIFDADDPRIHHGVWRFRLSYWSTAVKPVDKEKPDVELLGMPSPWATYHHGPPTDAPTGFTAYNAGPDARRLVWDELDALTYQFRYTADPTDDDEWTEWKVAKSGEAVPKLTMGTEYTFELRGLGATRAGVGDLHGPSASIMEMMPMATPTLPEIALLLLAMLLLGSGAYLLRGRQSGGLTHA